MQLDRAKAGIVTYGFEPMPPYGQAEWAQQWRARFVRTAPRHGSHIDVKTYTIEFSLRATAATVLVWGFCSTGVAFHTAGTPPRDSVMFDIVTTSSWSQKGESSKGEREQARNPILEMRPARRSLRDKAREEMSEFEREYPW